VIGKCFAAIEPLLGTKAACAAVGRARATHDRHQAPAPPRPPAAVRPAPPDKLTVAEAGRVLDILRSPRLMDLSPAQAFHILLDEGTYLASVSVFYRLLRAGGEVRERRRQASRPPRVAPAAGAPAFPRCPGARVRLRGLKPGSPHQRRGGFWLQSQGLMRSPPQ
jgi:putative transposase